MILSVLISNFQVYFHAYKIVFKCIFEAQVHINVTTDNTVCECDYIYACMNVYMWTCTCTYVCHVRVCVRECVCLRVYVCMCAWVCFCSRMFMILHTIHIFYYLHIHFISLAFLFYFSKEYFSCTPTMFVFIFHS